MEPWKKRVCIYLLSQTATALGSSIVGYAIIWYITLETSSSLMLTISILCLYIPQIIISFIVGVWADKYNKKFLIIIGDFITTFATLLMFYVFLLGNITFTIIFIFTIFRAIGIGIQIPVQNAFLPIICPKEKLTKVNSLRSTANSIMILLSPGLGGLLLATLGLAATMLIDVITGVTAIVLLILLKVDEKSKNNEEYSFVEEFRSGVNYLRKHSILGKMMLLYITFYFFLSAPSFFTSLLVERSFGGDVWRLAANEMFWGLGTVIGGIIIYFWGGFKNRVNTLAFASGMFGLAIILVGTVSNFIVYLFLMLLAGIFLPIFETANTVLIQETVEEDMQGRAFSNMQMLTSFAIPLGILLWGPLGDIISIESLLIITGVGIIIIATLFIIIGKSGNK